jgi:small nuclear ribonucleoprotein (snRNP)-like protein
MVTRNFVFAILATLNRTFLLQMTKIPFIIIEELVVVLRDGRTLIGRLKSIDQYGKHFFVNMFIPCYSH